MYVSPRRRFEPRSAPSGSRERSTPTSASFATRDGSAATARNCPSHGAPIPWYTYGAIEFLAERLPADATVFEFGAGYSTLWYASRTDKVVAVDPNREWVEILGPLLPENATVLWHSHPHDQAGYLGEIGAHDCLWDVVAIDSAWRVESAAVAIKHLSERGVVVWDNARDDVNHWFQRAWHDTFGPAGFRDLPFGGLIPIVPSFDRTSILYRPGNCLNI